MAAFFLWHLAQHVVGPKASPTPGHPGLQGAPSQTAKQLSTTASCRRLSPRPALFPSAAASHASSLRCAGWVVTLTAASSPCLASRAPLQPGRLQRQPAWPWSWQRPRGQRPTEAVWGTRCSAEPGSRPGGTEQAAAWSGGHFCADLGLSAQQGSQPRPWGQWCVRGWAQCGVRGSPGFQAIAETLGCLVRIACVHGSRQAARRRPRQSRSVFVSCSCCGRGLPSEEGAACCPLGWLAGLRHFCGKTEPRVTRI